MRIPVKLVSNLPVELRRHKLAEKELQHFNESGLFVRNNYKYLYRATIQGKHMWSEVATPSLAQAIWSIVKLWNAKEGDPYDRHDHPVIMTNFANDPVEIPNRETRRKLTKKKVLTSELPVAKSAKQKHNEAKDKKKD